MPILLVNENIDLINIDHHDDVFGGDYVQEMSDEDAYELLKFGSGT